MSATLPAGWVRLATRDIPDGWYAMRVSGGEQYMEGPYLQRNSAERALDRDAYGLGGRAAIFHKEGDERKASEPSMHRCRECGTLVKKRE